MEFDPKLAFEIIGALYYQSIQAARQAEQAVQQSMQAAFGPEPDADAMPEPRPLIRARRHVPTAVPDAE